MSAVQGMDLQKVQKRRKGALLVGLVGAVALTLVTGSWGGEGLHEAVEAFGLALILVCIVGRA